MESFITVTEMNATLSLNVWNALSSDGNVSVYFILHVLDSVIDSLYNYL